MGAVTHIECARCHISKTATADNFNKNSNTSHGFQTVCRPCRSEYEKALYQTKRDEICARARQHRLEHRDEVNSQARVNYKRKKASDPVGLAAGFHDYYIRNRDAVLAQAATYRKENAAALKDYFYRRARWFSGNLQILKSAQGCAVCGRKDGKLDYHHSDKTTKRHNVGSMHNCSLESFIEEVEKCVVLCASCHARHHRREQLEPDLIGLREAWERANVRG